MKNRFLISLFAFLSLVVNFVNPLAASGKELGNLPDNLTFDVNKFENYLRGKLEANTVGFAFVVNQNGQYLRGGNHGYSVLKKDDPNILSPWGLSLTTETRMNIASVTKPITATAVLKVIQDKKAFGYPNLTIDSKIEPFLPKNWVRGPGIKDLTFKQLMSQYSGMFDNGGGTDIKSLREWIKSGVTRPKNQYKYINGNLAIFRVILPYMLAPAQLRATLDSLALVNEEEFNKAVSASFKEAVRTLVFTPSGLQNIDMKSSSEIPTRLYNKNNNAPGYVVGDWTEIGGGGGWFMSATELAKFMAHLRYNDKILTPATRKLMDDNFLGWQDPAAWTQLDGKFGGYLGHGGLLRYNDGSPETVVGMVSCIVNFPSGIQAVLLVNSFGNYPNKEQLLRDAFDAAVVVKQVKIK